MTARILGAVILIAALAAGHHAQADALKLPGACVKPVQPPNDDGTPGTVHPADSIDLDGDGKPDTIIGNEDSCDGRGNCVYGAFVMRGTCGYLVGFGSNAMQMPLTVLPTMHAGLHDLQGTFLGIGEFDGLSFTFDGTSYNVVMVASAPRGGDHISADDQAKAEAEYKKGIAKARKLENSGDHAGAVTAFQAALAAGSADGATVSDEDAAQTKLELGASALAAKQLDLAEQTTRDGLFELHHNGEAAHGKLLGMGWFNLGMIAEARGDQTTAIDAYQQSVHYRPNRAVSSRVAAVMAAVLKTTPDGAGLPALSADGATLALRLGGKVAFVPVGAGFDASHATAALDDINAKLAAGRFHSILSRHFKDGDGVTRLSSLGIDVEVDVNGPKGRNVGINMDGLEIEPGANGNYGLGAPDLTVKSLTGVSIVRAPTAAYVYLELGGTKLQVVPLTLPGPAKK